MNERARREVGEGQKADAGWRLKDGDVINMRPAGQGGAVRKTIFKPKVMGSGSFIVDGDRQMFDLAFATGKNVATFKKMDFDSFLRDCGEPEMEEMKRYFENDRSKMEIEMVKVAEFLKSYKDMEQAMSKLNHSCDYLKDLVCDSILEKCGGNTAKAKTAIIKSIDIALAVKKEKTTKDDMEL
eukprot:Skav217768  [mRNA]  locus=scaffold1912:182868:183416:+ [translate_table: standard]